MGRGAWRKGASLKGPGSPRHYLTTIPFHPPSVLPRVMLPRAFPASAHPAAHGHPTPIPLLNTRTRGVNTTRKAATRPRRSLTPRDAPKSKSKEIKK